MKRNNKNPASTFIVVAIAGMIFLSIFSTAVVARRITDPAPLLFTYSFLEPVVQRNSDGYDIISIEGLSLSTNSGEPSLPVLGLQIPLPLNKKIKDIKVTGDSTYLGADFCIEPGRESIPLSSEEIYTSQLIPDPIIYNSEQLYPGSLFTDNGIHNFRGYSILSLTLKPIQYRPATGEIYYYRYLYITIELTNTDIKNQLFRGLQKDIDAVTQKIVDQGLSPYIIDDSQSSVSSLSEDDYDLLIISPTGFQSDYVPLADKHNETGVRTRIVTVVEILTEMDCHSGYEVPNSIRNYIKNEYLTKGIEYVLLGGDFGRVHTQILYFGKDDGVNVSYHSDLYFACLDGNFDGNGNGIFGEPDDDVDLVAEVYVGRAPCGSSEEVSNFVEKTIAYINAGIASGGKYIGRAILAGEQLQRTPDTWGGDSLEQLVDGSNADGYSTVGIPSDEFQIYRLYEKEEYWSKSDIIDLINRGVYIVDHLGHGNWHSAIKLDNSDVVNLSNTKSCFIYSQACNIGLDVGTGQPAGGDSYAAHMTVKTNHGAFAMIANTKEGWYAIGSTDGPSHRYNREFWDAVFGEGITSIGKANQDSKEDNIYRINESSMRWCYYTITLFGDPSLEFYEATSQPILHIKDISGGFGIESAIENTGDQNANSVSWSVSVKGGRFGFVNKSFTGDFELLEVGDNETIKTRSFFGFGRIDIIITANLPGEYPIRRVEKDKWFLFGCYVLQTSDRLKQLFERKFFER